MKTSLLISIYEKNSKEELNRCFDSIQNQRYIPEEIILIVDGPVEESVLAYIQKWCEVLPIEIFELDSNMGLAYALNYGLKLCSNDWVFRMDIDDVCAEGRFQKQIEFINSNADVDILGGDILCFESWPGLFSGRNVPYEFNEIKRFMKFRNPLNHPTVFFNRNKIMGIGGYPNARLGQDYLLWINAIINGLRVENSNDVLVYMQLDKASYSRRGITSLKYSIYPYFVMYKNGIINILEFFTGILIRFAYSIYCEIRSLVTL